MKLVISLTLFALLATFTWAQPRWYVNDVTGHDDFALAQFNDPTKPFKTIQFVIGISAQQQIPTIAITTQGGIWQPFDVMGVNVVIQGDESVFFTPFIDSTRSRTAGLTLLSATVFHVQNQTLISLKNFTCVDTNFQLAYPIDVEDAWWTSTRCTYIYNIFLPLGFGFNSTAPPMSQLVVARRQTAVEFVRDVFLFYDGFIADSQLGVTLFTTHDNGNILSDASVWGWEFGYKLPTTKAIVAESWNALTNCDPIAIQSCGQQRHTAFVMSWNLDTNDIDEIIFAKGHDVSIQFHGASARRLENLLAVKTKYTLHQVTGRSIVTALNLDVGSLLEVDRTSNPELILELVLTQSKGSLALEGSLSTGVRPVVSCGSTIPQVKGDDSTLIVDNCSNNSKLVLTLDAARYGHHVTIFKKNISKLELVAASGTKIMGSSKWSMGLLTKSVQLQFFDGDWYILSMF